MAKLTGVYAALVLSLVAVPAQAQMTTGTITGRITDAQGAAVPAVTVQAANIETGFIREGLSDESGTYHLAALPVGSYQFTAELQGFQRFTATAVQVNISRATTIDVRLQLATLTETVTVTATSGAIRSSSLGEVVDLTRIQSLPLNGRQFANLAATVPGVGLGFHSDSTKSAQYAPQISGGNGRNVNYIVDGGDNNDDTVGGLLQLFPLEAIQEFDVQTHRFDAEYGRSNGAVLNVVTKSGTNDLRGSWFTLFRDETLNARTMSEQIAGAKKQPYDRYQFGGSVGGPIVRNRTHYFAAYERTQQDTKQVIDTRGLFPGEDGIFDVPLRQNLFTAKVTAAPNTSHSLAIRYARDHNSQPTNVTPRTARSAWATSTNRFDSLNLNHNWVIGNSTLNELVAQVSDFVNDVPANGDGPSYLFLDGVRGGTNIIAPQKTEQRKYQFRNDFSWSMPGFGGIGHQFKAGVNWVHEPILRVFTGQATQGMYTLLLPDLNGPVQSVMFVGNNPRANFPLDLYGLYVQDDWRIAERLTINAGVRWDYVQGFPIDQSTSANFVAMQEAARSGRFAGTVLDEFASDPRSDKDNIQPRVGLAWDVTGSGRDVVRAGWGLYTDFGYIASNALVAAFDAAQAGLTFIASSNTGLRKQDGTFFRVTDSIETIQHLNGIRSGAAPAGEVASPVLEQPYSRQSSIGWSHQFDGNTTFTADYVRVDGRNLNMRIRPNTIVNGRRYLAGIPIQPMDSSFRVALSRGSSRYDGLIMALRRRMAQGVDFTASYTLSESTSDIGTAYDEVAGNLLLDVRDPFGPAQQGPSARTDSRHMISLTAIVQAPWDIVVAPVFQYRSALPVHTAEGIDFNTDGNTNDLSLVAYRYTGLDDTGRATFEEAGSCETVNCSRRAPFSQLNLRISRGVALPGGVRVEAIGEVFNLFNARNPFLGFTQRHVQANGTLNPQFMQPTAYAGDIGQTEQRVGQIGFRVTF